MRAVGLFSIALVACSPQAADVLPDEEPAGLDILGNETHDLSRLDVTEYEFDGRLRTPTDIEFNPDAPEELWILNQETSSSLVVRFPGTADEDIRRFREQSSGPHFLAKPSAIAFGTPGIMATAHEEDQPTQGSATPADFMGPTLWNCLLDVFNGGHASHLDMLHNSPNAVGIAWETENVYWVYDGYHGSLTRYDFAEDHGEGGSDHSDGVVARYVPQQMGYEPGVVSHLVYLDGLLYAADAAMGQIKVLDTATGERGTNVYPNYDGGEQYRMKNADMAVLVEGSEHGLEMPAGLELHDDLLFVSDHATSKIFAFDLEGELVDWVDTGLEPYSLQGMAFDEEGALWVVDQRREVVLRIAK